MGTREVIAPRLPAPATRHNWSFVREQEGNSGSDCAPFLKVKMLMRGSVSSNAPSRGKRWESSDTATMTAAAIVALTSVHHRILLLED